MFLSTEIFSKRRKIYSWIEEKPSAVKFVTNILKFNNFIPSNTHIAGGVLLSR